MPIAIISISVRPQHLNRLGFHVLTSIFASLVINLGNDVEQRTLSSITNARQKIGKEISELNERLKVSKDAIQRLKEEIAKHEQEDQDISTFSKSQGFQPAMLTAQPQTNLGLLTTPASQI